MADVNQEHAELLAQINRELEMFGRILPDTAERLNDAETGIKNFTKVAGLAGAGLGKVGDAAMAAASAMYQGKKGASAFNGTLDEASKAVELFGAALMLLIPGGPLIKALVAGVTLATTSVIKYGKAANEMADKLYKGATDIQRAGALGADGMTGVFESAKALGYSMDELGEYVGIITANSKEFALLGGSVVQGRRRFDDMAKALEPVRIEFLQAGVGLTEFREGMAGYLKLQAQMGYGQKKTVDELAAGARNYLIEMDALAALTGQQRQELEATMERARSEQRFRAKLEEIRATQGEAAAQRVERANILVTRSSAELGQAFRDNISGVLSSDAAIKGFVGTQGALSVETDKFLKGRIDEYQLTTQLGKAASNTAKSFNSVAQLGLYDFGIDFAQSMEAGTFANNDLAKMQKIIQEEQRKRGLLGGKAQDNLMSKQAVLIDTQIRANEALERFVKEGIGPAQDAMIALAKATKAGTETLNKLFGINQPAAPKREVAKDITVAKEQAKVATEQRKAAEKSVEDLQKERERLEKEKGRADQETVKARIAEAKARREAERARAEEQTKRQQVSRLSGVTGQRPPVSSAAPSGPSTSSAPSAPSESSGKTTQEKPISQVVSSKPGEITIKTPDGDQQRRVGSANWRMNNPGNLRPTDWTQQQPGYVGQGIAGDGMAVGSFAVFKTKDDGDRAKENLLFGKNTAYSNMDIASAMHRYAPEKDNNKTEQYIKTIVDALGVPASTRLADLNPSQRDKMLSTISRYEGFKPGKVLEAAEGGIVAARPGGTFVKAAEAGVDEAFIPLKNGTVPVSLEGLDKLDKSKPIKISLDLKDAMSPNGVGPTFAGVNEWTGINQGPMTTDLNALKDIASSLGAFDKATQTITDPNTWKQILSSGLLTNYDLGPLTLGTQSFGKDIGVEIGERIKEIASSNNEKTDFKEVLDQVRKEMGAALMQVVEKIQSTESVEVQSQMLEALNAIKYSQERTASASQKMAQLAAN